MRYNNIHNGCTIIQSTTGVLRRKLLGYDQLKNRNPKYTTDALVRGNTDILVIPDNYNKETTSIEMSLRTLSLGVSSYWVVIPPGTALISDDRK